MGWDAVIAGRCHVPSGDTEYADNSLPQNLVVT